MIIIASKYDFSPFDESSRTFGAFECALGKLKGPAVAVGIVAGAAVPADAATLTAFHDAGFAVLSCEVTGQQARSVCETAAKYNGGCTTWGLSV